MIEIMNFLSQSNHGTPYELLAFQFNAYPDEFELAFDFTIGQGFIILEGKMVYLTERGKGFMRCPE